MNQKPNLDTVEVILTITDEENCNVVVKKFENWQEAARQIKNLCDAGWNVDVSTKQQPHQEREEKAA